MQYNGQIVSLEKGIGLIKFLKERNYNLSQIAVELNGSIVSKQSYEEILLHDEDVLEVVSFVGGG
ncbi:sulfur carrier protein ThiS [Niameybacter massiliensis]|uniref:sulfur carrier protein ThiS n=1 Tax=Niameybacter massiliensis TaxID=1658108 RepID=UPI0006B48AF3|nr:sulfur carrier protein ThiS [Niameybacter massiliensis]